MGRMRIVLVLAAACAMLVAGVAVGHTKRWESTVKFKDFDPTIQAVGRVTSKKTACFAGRHVVIVKRGPGPDELVGAGDADSHGRFSIPANDGPGDYYAEVLKDVIKHDGRHKHVCGYDKSGTVNLD
jgi:hypothetical protein